MYKKNQDRIASSSLKSLLFGDVEKYRKILSTEKNRIMKIYRDDSILDNMFSALDSRIINICPMVMCDSLLQDIGIQAPNKLLAGIGLSMFSISTHDDLVDELPRERVIIAGLTYSGNISTLDGISVLIHQGYNDVAIEVIELINQNHYYQTKIVSTLWKNPTDEKGYLDAISHTKYWLAIGLRAAIVFSKRNDLIPFADEFAECYGTTCQLFDDMREIHDDVKNGYYSLPISLSMKNGWSLKTSDGLNASIARSRELAFEYLERAKVICGTSFPKLSDLINRMEEIGGNINY